MTDLQEGKPEPLYWVASSAVEIEVSPALSAEALRKHLEDLARELGMSLSAAVEHGLIRVFTKPPTPVRVVPQEIRFE